MKIIPVFALLILNTILCSCGPKNEHQKTSPIEGLWTLHTMEQKDSLGNWNEWRGGMQGYLLYDATENMALHLLPKGYEETKLRFPNFSDTISLDALKHITGSYVYVGNYEVFKDDNIVQHTRLSHSNPGDWGKVVKRKFSFSKDTLIIVPAEEENARLRLKWLRVE